MNPVLQNLSHHNQVCMFQAIFAQVRIKDRSRLSLEMDRIDIDFSCLDLARSAGLGLSVLTLF